MRPLGWVAGVSTAALAVAVFLEDVSRMDPPRDGFSGRLRVEEDGRYWRLLEPLRYRGNEEEWEAEVGFRTDLGSVPQLAQAVVRNSGEANRPFVLHDLLCRTPGVSYRDADRLLRRAMRELEVAPSQTVLVYAGVRIGHRVLRLGPEKGGPR